MLFELGVPVTALVVPGFRRLWRLDAGAAFRTFAIVAASLLLAAQVSSGGAVCAVPVVPFALLPAARGARHRVGAGCCRRGWRRHYWSRSSRAAHGADARAVAPRVLAPDRGASDSWCTTRLEPSAAALMYRRLKHPVTPCATPLARGHARGARQRALFVANYSDMGVMPNTTSTACASAATTLMQLSRPQYLIARVWQERHDSRAAPSSSSRCRRRARPHVTVADLLDLTGGRWAYVVRTPLTGLPDSKGDRLGSDEGLIASAGGTRACCAPNTDHDREPLAFVEIPRRTSDRRLRCRARPVVRVGRPPSASSSSSSCSSARSSRPTASCWRSRLRAGLFEHLGVEGAAGSRAAFTLAIAARAPAFRVPAPASWTTPTYHVPLREERPRDRARDVESRRAPGRGLLELPPLAVPPMGAMRRTRPARGEQDRRHSRSSRRRSPCGGSPARRRGPARFRGSRRSCSCAAVVRVLRAMSGLGRSRSCSSLLYLEGVRRRGQKAESCPAVGDVRRCCCCPAPRRRCSSRSWPCRRCGGRAAGVKSLAVLVGLWPSGARPLRVEAARVRHHPAQHALGEGASAQRRGSSWSRRTGSCSRSSCWPRSCSRAAGTGCTSRSGSRLRAATPAALNVAPHVAHYLRFFPPVLGG